MTSARDDRLLIFTPTGRDAPLAIESLKRAGMIAEACVNFNALMTRIEESAAGAIIAQEAMTRPDTETLAEWVQRQPPWSDFPIILIAAAQQLASQSAARYKMFQRLGNLTILERPFHRETLLVAAQSALRNRRRQYEARAYLLERKEIADELESRVIERTRALVNTQNALHQSQKLEAIGRLAGGVAHDFNNLMTGIQGLTEDLKENMPDDDPRKNDLAEILQAAGRASALTKQLLAFGRKQVLNPTNVNVNEGIIALEPFIKRFLREDIRLELSLSPEVGPIWIDKTSFEQILLNLIMNARDAMLKDGVLKIETRAIETSGPNPTHVSIQVTDSGTGMPPEILDRIFEPFFTTKEAGKGTGLGLPTVYGNVKQSGGDIQVTSQLGKGTTFKLTWPVSSVLLEDEIDQASSARGGQESILIVEDEDIVRHVATMALRRRGYNVLQASNGEEAEKIWEENKNAIDLLLCDVVMPGMDGKQVAQNLTSTAPQIPVLYMSGHTEDVILQKGILDKGIAFIQKPFTADELCRKVRGILDLQSAALQTASKA